MAQQNTIQSATAGAANQAGTLHAFLKGTVTDLVSQGMRIPQDLGILLSLGETELANGLINDKNYLVSKTDEEAQRDRLSTNKSRVRRSNESSSSLLRFLMVPRLPAISADSLSKLCGRICFILQSRIWATSSNTVLRMGPTMWVFPS